MATIVSWNGSNYSVPATGEENWGGATKVDGLLISLVNNGFQKTGGTFTLSADADFGATAGLKSIYYKSRGTVSSAGIIRLAKTEVIGWRNNADSGNNTLTTDTSDRLTYNGTVIASSTGIVPPTAGGTGVGNNAASIITISGSYALTATLTNTTSVTFPTTGTLATLAGSEDFSNKHFLDTTCLFKNASDTSKRCLWSISGATASTATTLTFVQTTNRAITFPDASDTLVGKATVDTFSNKTILVNGSTAGTCLFADSSDTAKRCLVNLAGATTSTATTLIFSQSTDRSITFPNATTTLVGTDVTQTLTNKTLTAPVIATISNTGTITLPTATDTLVGRATTDTLTNKTLTAPVIATIVNTGTLTLPTSTDTLVGRAATDTLTNKTLTTPTINQPTINGVTDGSSAGSGVLGQYTESKTSAATAWPAATATFCDLGSISLGAGEWVIDCFVNIFIGTAASMSRAQIGVGTASGTSATGTSYDSNFGGYADTLGAGGYPTSIAVPGVRVTISGTTTYYLKGYLEFAGGTPDYRGRISARRVR